MCWFAPGNTRFIGIGKSRVVPMFVMGMIIYRILPFLSYRSPSFQEAVADDIVSVDHMSSGGLRNRRGRNKRQEPVPDP